MSENEEVEVLLDSDPSQTQEELAESLNVDRSTISRYLRGIGMICNQRNRVPYELKPRNVERHRMTSPLSLERQRTRFFPQHIVTGDDK
ncbi:hypothetical protein AVEN_160015-1 [Araneus ventricosus]|uniref:HTH cro/C1-type domain-containing protein n=1 Tax=Araneus ventricosus TaxID=182803 RepID=A0A4Y2WDC6_ARAVE|nr:hypothetical protein AVEN_76302-1 [Araneus ventricosus]GBO35456.1 hypothetical protein AVEN_160015-1 [Araneus ventricosus]